MADRYDFSLGIEEFVAAQPTAKWPLRLPIIRHIRAVLARRRVNRHYDFWYSYGAIPLYRDHDDAVIDAIWRGEK